MVITAIPAGFAAGLFGIGGGLITVPILFYIFGSAGDFISLGRKGTGPSFRTEVSHEFDKPFNSSVVADPFTGQLNTGSPNLLVAPEDVIEERDVTSVMIGFDYPFWVPGWESQEKSIFTSVQFFNIHTEDADNLLSQAPYSFNEAQGDGKRRHLEGIPLKL